MMETWRDMATCFNFLEWMYPDTLTLSISGCRNDLYHFSLYCQKNLPLNSFTFDTCEANFDVVNSLVYQFWVIQTV